MVLAETMAPPRRRDGRDEDDADRRRRRRVDDVPTLRNEYSGWTPSPIGAPHAVERVPFNSLSTRDFFARYVATRRPVILTGGLQNTPWARAASDWTDSFLASAAGDETVRVEVRDADGDRYGVGKYARMRFADFLRKCSSGDERVYLSASPSEVDAHGRPRVVSPPASRLLGDTVPFRPEITGNLVPANVNLWMGYSRVGASSGLHHDHHDNLYVLLRGVKRFELYAPSEISSMYTVGNPTRVHPNGRVNYEESGPTAADGDDGSLGSRRSAFASAAAEAELAEAEEALDRGEPGATERVERAEEALDAIMDAAFEGRGKGTGNGSASNDFDVRDDFDDLDDDNEGEVADERGGGHEDEGDPPSFSRVDRGDLGAFPLFERARETKRAEAELRAGEALYLPAGWFHEVTSSGGAHAALNYWFHPPTEDAFDAPYGMRQEAWESDWAAWEALRASGEGA